MIYYSLAALMGMLVKIVDQLEDVLKNNSPVKYILAIIYGIIGGCIISYSSFSSLWIAALFAQLLAGKLDRPVHMLGFSASLLFSAIFGIADFRLFDTFAFLIAAFIDESNPLGWNPAIRPALKLASLAFALIGRWDYLFAILLFDIAYFAVGMVIPEKPRKPIK
ncbi:MAG: hypothetical protein WC488_01200 [Candidatus Micrarchaeia archaeon]